MKKKTKFDFWFYKGNDHEEMYHAIKAIAQDILNRGFFSVAFVKIQNIYRNIKYGYDNENKLVDIKQIGMNYVGAAYGELPDMMSQLFRVFENNADGIAEIMGFENRFYAAKMIVKLLYENKCRKDDPIIVFNDKDAGGTRVYTHSFTIADASYFAAMVSSLIVGGKYDEIKSALWYFEQAAKEKVDEKKSERERINEEIKRLQERLKKL